MQPMNFSQLTARTIDIALPRKNSWSRSLQSDFVASLAGTRCGAAHRKRNKSRPFRWPGDQLKRFRAVVEVEYFTRLDDVIPAENIYFPLIIALPNVRVA